MKDKSKNNCKTLAILKNHLEKMASVDGTAIMPYCFGCLFQVYQKN